MRYGYVRRTVLFAWLSLLLLSVTAYPQDSRKRSALVLTDVQIIGSSLDKGLDLNSFNAVLKFALSANPNLDVSIVPAGVSGADKTPDAAKLASIVQAAGETTLWAGDLTLVDGKTTVRLGPVILGDSKGPRVEAPSLIADLVFQSLRDKFASHSPLAIRLGCFKSEGKEAGAIAADLRAGLGSSFQRERSSVRRAALGPECELNSSARESDEALITAIVEAGGVIAVMPYLSWRYHQDVPLPQFRDEEVAYVQLRREYIEVVVRAVQSYLTCRTPVVMDGAQARDSSGPARVEVARKILQSQDCPYLAAAMLENSQLSDTDVVLDTARAYRQAKEPGTALRILKKAVVAIQSPPEARAEAQYELALAAFDLQRFPEENFKAALDAREFSDAHYPYAVAAYLTDDNKLAEEQINFALTLNGDDPAARMLAAFLALDRVSTRDQSGTNIEYLDKALKHTKIAYQFATDKTQVRRFARQIAFKAVEGWKAQEADPRSVRHLLEAEDALGLLPPDDADSLRMRGGIRLALGKNAEALDDLRTAAQIAKKSPTIDPPLQIIDVELAEAYLLNSNFAEAQRLSQRFLAEKRPRESSTSTFEPVAYLLKYAAEALATRNENRQSRQALLKKIKQYHQWPTLTVALTTADKKKVDLPIVVWEFNAFDRYVCDLKGNPARDSVLKVSRATQKQLGADTPQTIEEVCQISHGSVGQPAK
jgi:hypothetical protein